MPETTISSPDPRFRIPEAQARFPNAQKTATAATTPRAMLTPRPGRKTRARVVTLTISGHGRILSVKRAFTNPPAAPIKQIDEKANGSITYHPAVLQPND